MSELAPAPGFEPEGFAGTWFLIASTHEFWRLRTHTSLSFERDDSLWQSGIRFKQRTLLGKTSMRELWGRNEVLEPGRFAWKGQGHDAAWTVARVDPTYRWAILHFDGHKVARGAALEIYARGPTIEQTTLDEIAAELRANEGLRHMARGMTPVAHDHRPPRPYRLRL